MSLPVHTNIQNTSSYVWELVIVMQKGLMFSCNVSYYHKMSKCCTTRHRAEKEWGGLEGWLFRFCGIFEFHFPLSKISLCHRKDYVCSQSKYLRAHSESTPHSTPVNNQSLIVARLSLASLLSLLHQCHLETSNVNPHQSVSAPGCHGLHLPGPT